MSLREQPGTIPTRAVADREQQIERLLGRWQQALERQDAAAAAACYTDDAVLFDLAPPLRERGMNQRRLQAWLDSWATGPAYQMRDVQLVTDENTAYCLSSTHLGGTKAAGEQVDLWFRATVCLRRSGGEWRIAHEHVSVPFLMDGSFKAAVNLRPDDH